MKSLTKEPAKAVRITLDELQLLKENIGETVVMDRIEYSDEVVLEDIIGCQFGEDYYLTHFIANDRGRTEQYPIDETKYLSIRRSRDERLLWDSFQYREKQKNQHSQNKYLNNLENCPLVHA